MSVLGDTAVAYAVAGARVFPCEPGGKRPLGAAAPHGKDSASSDVDIVDAWWCRWPDANIGMRLPDGVAAIDIDPASRR